MKWCAASFVVATLALAMGSSPSKNSAQAIDEDGQGVFNIPEFLVGPFAPTEGASTECLGDGKIYFDELENYSPWAMQMYDASAKLSPGVFTGNTRQLGNYDECLKIDTGLNFAAQACNALIKFEILNGSRTSNELDMKDFLLQIAEASKLNDVSPHSTTYEWMWCLPSTCNGSEVSRALELGLRTLKVKDRVDITASVGSCHTLATDAKSLDAADWSYVCLLLVLLTIIVSSTVYDVYGKRTIALSNSEVTKRTVLSSFSIYTNGKYLLSTKRSKHAITCLDGLRYISICWIIYGHTFYMEAMNINVNRFDIFNLHEDWSSLLVLNSNIICDTFFLLSGVLLAYTFLMKNRKSRVSALGVIKLYINRYLRITPTYAIIIGFYATLFDKLGSGPTWDTWIHNSKLDCQANWWTNLLYINNYVNISNICMSQTWYVSVDMQLFLISPIFLLPMLRPNRELLLWIVTSLGLFISILLPFCITYFLELTGTMFYYKNSQDVVSVFLQIYTRVYTRAGPFIIGLTLGYILFKTKDYRIRISWPYVLAGWVTAAIAGTSSVLGPRGMYFDDHTYNQLEASFYAGFHRHAFTLAISWIIFACVNGYAGPLNSFLSWRGWTPLSKLTYSAYLTHYIVLLYSVGTARSPGYLTTFNVLRTFFGNLCLAMLISLCVSCCVEMPFMVLSRQLFGRKRRADGMSVTATKPEQLFHTADAGGVIYKSAESIDGVFIISEDRYGDKGAETEKRRPGTTEERVGECHDRTSGCDNLGFVADS